MGQRRERARVVIWSALLAALLAGCADGSSGLLVTGGSSPDTTLAGPAASGAGAAYPTSASAVKPAFSPFNQDGTDATPGREVIANPSLAEVLKPGPLPEFSLGRADAPVVMVKYMSLTCPHCRRFMAETFPALKREYIDTGKVRLVIREFPIGKTSGNATIALRCAPMDRYLPLYQKFLEQQATWVSQEVRPEAIMKVASQVGLTAAQFDGCVKDQAMIEGLKVIKERGRALGIIGTPNFFIGNKLVKTVVGMAEIRALVNPLLAGSLARAG